MELKKDFSPKECDIMIDILNNCKTNNLTSARLSKAIDVNYTHPQFRSILKYLKEIKILEDVDTISSNVIIRIDQDKLADLIRYQLYIDGLVSRFFSKWCPLAI